MTPGLHTGTNCFYRNLNFRTYQEKNLFSAQNFLSYYSVLYYGLSSHLPFVTVSTCRSSEKPLWGSLKQLVGAIVFFTSVLHYVLTVGSTEPNAAPLNYLFPLPPYRKMM